MNEVSRNVWVYIRLLRFSGSLMGYLILLSVEVVLWLNTKILILAEEILSSQLEYSRIWEVVPLWWASLRHIIIDTSFIFHALMGGTADTNMLEANHDIQHPQTVEIMAFQLVSEWRLGAHQYKTRPCNGSICWSRCQLKFLFECPFRQTSL